MAGCVDQIELISDPVSRFVVQTNGLGLDGDAPFPLDIHAVEHLLLHLTLRETAAGLDQPIGKGGLAVVNMRDDGEITNMGELCHGRDISLLAPLSNTIE